MVPLKRYTSEKVTPTTWDYYLLETTIYSLEALIPISIFSYKNLLVRARSSTFHVISNVERHKVRSDSVFTPRLIHKWNFDTIYMRLFSIVCWGQLFVLVFFRPRICLSKQEFTIFTYNYTLKNTKVENDPLILNQICANKF